MRLDYDGRSMKGSVRKRNEDSILVRSHESVGLFLVADGIGGSAYGAESSAIIRDRYDLWWSGKSDTISFGQAVEELKLLLLRINREIYEKYGQFHAGSTIVLLYIHGGDALCLSSGDSRIYRARGLKCVQLTRDDIFENLPKKPRGYGPENNGKLVGAVGIRETVDYSIKTETVKQGDRFFLCSDGVYKYHSLGKLSRGLALASLFFTPWHMVRLISDEVEKRGAGDNYSMIFVRAV